MLLSPEIEIIPCVCPIKKNKLGYQENFHNAADELTEIILGISNEEIKP